MNTENKKTCSIALMSGKGGSGKTTLALSMASLLSSCGVKTLLVDCDLSTNGATYFFEDEMSYYSHDISSLHQVIQNLENTCTDERFSEKYKNYKINSYPVNDYFDFFPSVTKVSESWSENSLDSKLIIRIREFFENLALGYDVVIYDCQAGYTKLLEAIIPVSDRNLMVLEADSISASAVRNLFLKLNQAWGAKKIYQIFSKATEEEEEIYSKVSAGTMFDNIGCIRFDWTVRSAFSISKIPDMVHTSANYGKQVCDLCDNLIRNPEITRKIDQFKSKRKISELKDRKNKIEEDYNQFNQYLKSKDSNNRKRKFIDSLILPLIILEILLCGGALLYTIFGPLFGFISIDEKERAALQIASIMCIFMTISITHDDRVKRIFRKSEQEDSTTDIINKMNMSIEQINKEIVEEEQKLKDIKNYSSENDSSN